MTAHIEIHTLFKKYSHIEALRGISVEIERGSFVTVLGPNGAGKSTFLKILSTLLKPTSGEVSISGFDLVKGRNSIRKISGLISHETMLYDNLSALENLEFISVFYGIDNKTEKCEKLLRDVGLFERRNDFVKTFSRGMKQRLSIARSLIHQPDILLLDEPYSGLDQDGIRNLTSILQGLKNDGRTILLTTHNFDEGLELSDRVFILNNGKIVFDKAKSEIKQDLKDIYFNALVSC